MSPAGESQLSFHDLSSDRGLWVLVCVRQIDVPAVCAGKVMKAALKHIEIIAKAREKGKFLYQLTPTLNDFRK